MCVKKECKTCGEVKEVIEFKKNGYNKLGEQLYKPHCLLCFRKIDRENRLKRIEKLDPNHADRIRNYREGLKNRGDKPDNHQWCFECEKYKPISDFSPHNLKNYGKCRVCASEYDIQRARKLKLQAIEYLGGKCKKCGFIGHYASFDFHHINPKEKEFNWNVGRKQSWDKIIIELDKCIVLCKNCHGMTHCKLNNDGTSNSEYCITND